MNVHLIACYTILFKLNNSLLALLFVTISFVIKTKISFGLFFVNLECKNSFKLDLNF